MGVYVTEQPAEVALVAARVQGNPPNEPVPLLEKLIVPVGLVGLVAEVSVTFAVQVVA